MGYWDAAAQGSLVGRGIGEEMYPDGSPLEVQAKQQQLALRDAELQNVPLEMESKRQQNALRGLTLQQQQQAVTESTRQLALAAGMRQAAANAKATPVVTATTENGGYTPVPADPAASFASARALIGSPAEYRTQAYDPAKTFGDNDLPAGVTTIPQEKYNAETAGSLNYTPAAPFNPLEDPLQEKAARDAQPKAMTVTTPGAPANPLKAQIEYLNSVGETQKAQELVNTLMDHANKVLTLTGNPNDALKIINDATGEKLAYSPLASLDAVTSDGQLVGYIDKNKYRELTSTGAQPLEAMKGAMVPLDLGGGGKAVLDFLAKHPDATDAEVAEAGSKAGVPLSKMIPLLAERQKVAAMKAADDRQREFHEDTLANQRRMQANSDRMFALAVERFNQDRSTPEDRSVIAGMLARGEMEPSDVGRSKDRIALLAEAKKINPEFDPRLTKAQNATLANLVKTRGIVDSNERDANKNFDQLLALHKKLGNGTIPAINEVINRLKEGTGAPEPGTAAGVAYEALTQYARVINKTTGGASVTDTARKEANNLLPILRLNNAQVASRIAQYRVTMRNTLTSQDEAIKAVRGETPAAGNGGQQIAPAGTKVAKKGGGFYTSDGKGGWH